MTVTHKTQPLQELVSLHQRRVDLIEQCANEARKSEFERRWLAIIVRCAQWFSTVPLNPDIYREPGGAFRCTVETAFYAMRLAGGQKFGTNLPSEQRRRVEPQYNYSVFLAAVCSGLDEPYRHFAIVRDSDRAEWNPSVHGAAAPWLGDAPYHVHRRQAPFPVQRMRTGMLAQILVGQELLTDLDPAVLADLSGAINPEMQPQGAESLVHKVVRQAVTVAADFGRKAQQGVFAPVQFTVPSAVHVAATLQPVAATPAQPATAPASGPGTSSAAPPPPTGTPATAAPAAATPAQSTSPSAAARTLPAANTVSTVPTGKQASTGTPRGRGGPTSLAEAIGLGTEAPSGPGTVLDLQTGEITTSHVASRGVDPTEFSLSPPAGRVSPGGAASLAEADEAAFLEVLKDVPNMIRELFRALREDVAGGRAKVVWGDKGLVIQKRLIGNYGVASETMVEHLRKRGLLVANGQGEITLAPRAGLLILERP